MARETAQQLAYTDAEDDAAERTASGRDLAEVEHEPGMPSESFAETITEPADSPGSEGNIVVDVRSGDVTIEISPSIEVVEITETRSAPDIGALVPLRVHRTPTAPERSYPEPDADTDPVLDPVEAPAPDVDPLGGLVAATALQRSVKRMLDFSIAAASLVLISPLLLIVAAAVKLTSPGPVLYRSTRVGRNGEEFEFLKFRSMYANADADRDLLNELNEQTGPVFKMKDDPRITPLGRLLRKTSIDEFPQLLHVLRGTMSMVGPRPPLPREVAEYDDRARQRLLVTPGITCIWQVSGRSTLDFDIWVDMDLEYIRTWSLLGDIGLLFRTIPAVASGKGAF